MDFNVQLKFEPDAEIGQKGAFFKGVEGSVREIHTHPSAKILHTDHPKKPIVTYG